MCGENTIYGITTHQEQGSSPRVRGKLRIGQDYGPAIRLIPACAGKTPWTKREVSETPAHPRVCGENVSCVGPAADNEGSSPRVRGKQNFGRGVTMRVRLIPACAGKTPRHIPDPYWIAAHPRVCGENAMRYCSLR